MSAWVCAWDNMSFDKDKTQPLDKVPHNTRGRLLWKIKSLGLEGELLTGYRIGFMVRSKGWWWQVIFSNADLQCQRPGFDPDYMCCSWSWMLLELYSSS